MKSLIAVAALALTTTAFALPALASSSATRITADAKVFTPASATTPRGSMDFRQLNSNRFKICTPGSLGYTHFFGPYGEPQKRDNCTGQVTSDY
jgi:hypothetical protein